MHHQPEFCRWVDSWHMPESPESGCHRANVPYKKSWEGQLTIHGLWPALYNGSHPTMCTDENFNPALLAGLEVAMEQNWTNIRSINTKVRSSTWSYDDTSLWSHEWHTHGTCSGMDQYTYFSTALQSLVPTPPIVKERYRSDGGAGVVTRSELLAGYSFSTAVAEADSRDLVAIISCNEDGYLSEVHICYEKKNITNLHHYNEEPKCYTDEQCKEECLKQRKVCRTEVAAKNIPLSAAYNYSIKICNTDTDECMHNELHATLLSPHDGGGESNVGKRILCSYTMNWMDNCGENIKIASFIQPKETMMES